MVERGRRRSLYMINGRLKSAKYKAEFLRIIRHDTFDNYQIALCDIERD